MVVPHFARNKEQYRAMMRACNVCALQAFLCADGMKCDAYTKKQTK